MVSIFGSKNLIPGKLVKTQSWDFPRGTVDKNLPTNARDMGSIPGPGRSYMLQSN